MAKRTRVSVVNNCSSAIEFQTLKINSRRWSMSMLNLSIKIKVIAIAN